MHRIGRVLSQIHCQKNGKCLHYGPNATANRHKTSINISISHHYNIILHFKKTSHENIPILHTLLLCHVINK